ncbi:MmgE/PrpD family protein [Chloroflexota bacterium]
MQYGKESKDATRKLVKFSVETSFEDLSPEAIHATKRMVLDSIGVTLVGSLFPSAKCVTDTMLELGGANQATIISNAKMVPAPNAAFANAELLYATEMDAVFQNFGHITAYVFPTILSLAEYTRTKGKDFVTALAVGYDVSARIGLSLSPLVYLKGDVNDVTKMEIGTSETYGFGWTTFGCVAGGGRLLGLDEGHMAHAFGLAGYTAPSPFMMKAINESPPTMAKDAVAGWQCHNVVTSLLLAKRGYTGDKRIFDGPMGFWKFWGSIRWDTDVLFDALGEKWWVTHQTYKLWPMVSLLFNNIELTQNLVKEHKIMPEEVDAIEFYGHPVFVDSPIFSTDKIEDEIGAEWNAKFSIAMAVLGLEEKYLDWVLKKYWEDERVKSLMEKVEIKAHPKLNELIYKQIGTMPYPGIYRWPSEIVIKARDKEFRAYKEYFKGHDAIHDSRLNDDELKEKFLGNALRILPRDKCNCVIEIVMNLEKLDFIDTLTQYLRPF